MTRISIIALFTFAGSLVTGPEADAQVYRGRARTGHVAVGPMGGASAGRTRTAVNSGPFGSSAMKAQTRTRVTPGGTTIQAGSVAGSRSGPLGASAGRAGGVKVTTPSGQTHTHASRGRVAAGPGGVAAAGSSRATTSGPFGAAGAVRAGAVVGR
jgi:hypothetical protein